MFYVLEYLREMFFSEEPLLVDPELKVLNWIRRGIWCLLQAQFSKVTHTCAVKQTQQMEGVTASQLYALIVSVFERIKSLRHLCICYNTCIHGNWGFYYATSSTWVVPENV